VLRIDSLRDVSPLYEAFSEEDDEHGNPIFLYPSFGYISDDFTAYFGRSKLRKYDLTSKDIKKSLELLPDQDVYPQAPWNITTFTIPIDNNVFFKRSKATHGFYWYRIIAEAYLAGSQDIRTSPA
jgi:hypothetical protein